MRGLRPATGINSPQRGGQIPQGVPPAPRALLGVGRHAPGPLGCAPWCAFAHRALLPWSPSRSGSGHGCARWPGWSTRSVVHAGRPAPSPLNSVFQRPRRVAQAGRGLGACPPGRKGGGQPGPGGGRPGCSRRLCPPSTDWARLSTGDRVQGRSGSSEQSNRANIFSFAQPTRAKPRQYWVSREPLYKKIGDPDCTTLCNLTTKMQSKQQLSTF